MKAENLMTRNVSTCSQRDSLEEAAHVMWESDVGCLVVVDDDKRPIGMITDRDVLMAAYTRGIPLRDALVESAMSREVLACSTATPLRELEQSMQAAQVRRVPVTDPNGKLVGIVGMGDIARTVQSTPLHLAEAPGLAKTLASVTQPRARTQAAAE
jgi:CBS domain-containing protein